MAIRIKPDSGHASSAEWSDKEVQRFASYSRLAVSHAMGRNARIVKILCYLSLLRSVDKFTAHANIMVVAARWQNYSSTAGNQAAHFLPGQLMVNARILSELAQDPQTRTKIGCLFGDVEDLPADFNKADTQAEANGKAGGLCAAFEGAARHLIANASPANTINRAAVRSSYYNVWVPQARLAFNNALVKKADKYTRPELEYGAAGGVEYGMITNLSARENASKYEQRINHQQEILRYYLRSLDKHPSELVDTNMNEIERGFKA